ncbi:hypothetical protein LIA77_11717 [Sarocladium implicatum]|nr:hypothetical protein LIA77_11717 [Sarocladium implicatum]
MRPRATQTHLNKKIEGYELGGVRATGAITSELIVAGTGVPLQAFIDAQYLDSITMSRQPGMYHKYLPYLYDEVTGKLISGGRYLFDTYEDAKEYVRWLKEEFELWKTVGAYNFTLIGDHALGRLQKWEYTSSEEEIQLKLRALYPELRDAASARGASSVWLMYDPEKRTVGLQLAFAKSAAHRDAAGVQQDLVLARQKGAVGEILSESLATQPVYDRTSIFLTLWLAKSIAADGPELTIPYYPIVPDITHEYT